MAMDPLLKVKHSVQKVILTDFTKKALVMNIVDVGSVLTLNLVLKPKLKKLRFSAKGGLKPKEKVVLKYVKKYQMEKFKLPKDSKRLKFEEKDVRSVLAQFFPHPQS